METMLWISIILESILYTEEKSMFLVNLIDSWTMYGATYRW